MAGYDAAELQTLAGPLEVKFKGGAFATWSDVFVRLEGRWLAVHRRERDATRLGAVELGPGVRVTELQDPEAAAKFPRRLDVSCRGGLLPKTEFNLRAKSRKDRDAWANAIAANLRVLSSAAARDPRWGVQDLEPLVVRMLQALPLHAIRIRSDRSVRCATGEAIVTFLKAEGVVSDRAQATLLGRRLLAMNLLHHVVWEKDFADSGEPYVLVDTQALALGDVDDEAMALALADASYQVEHFLKYMDARKFWKFFERPDNREGERDAISSTSTSHSNGSARSGSGRSTRAGGSSEPSERSVSSSRGHTSTFVETPREPMLPPSACHVGQGNGSSSGGLSGLSGLPPALQATDDASRRFSTLSVSTSGLTTPDSVLELPQPAAGGGDKKAKKCGVCTKSFNPLRRRHHCRVCGAVVCSSCSVVRKARGVSHASSKSALTLSIDDASSEKDAGHTRICISCKLSAASSVGSEPDELVDRMASDLSNSQRGARLEATSSSLDLSLSQRSTASQSSQSSQPPSGGLRRQSSGRRPSPLHSGARGTRCHDCADQRCAPVRERCEIPYAVETQSPDASGEAQYVAAQALDRDEAARLETVQSVVETMAATPGAKRVLAQFCHMAAIASQCPLAFVGLLDRDNLRLKAQHGLQDVACPPTLPRRESLAAHTCRSDAPLVCSDLTRDVRFRENPWRRGTLGGAVFYAGVPLTLSNGQTVGVLEVFDRQPRFECGEVVEQLQAVVRGLLKLFEDILAAAAQARLEEQEKQRQEQQQQQQQDKPAENAMEAQLLQLLSQTTSTQEQLRTQQGQMVHAISSHSKQISELAKQLERMESTLAAKLGEGGDLGASK